MSDCHHPEIRPSMEPEDRERRAQRCVLCGAEFVLASRLDASQKAIGIIYGLAERLPPDVDISAWLREIQEVCGQVWTVPIAAKMDMAPLGRCGKCGSPIWPSELTGTTCNCVVERQCSFSAAVFEDGVHHPCVRRHGHKGPHELSPGHYIHTDEDVSLCEDCPPVGYPTDKTRCLPCPRRVAPPEYAEPPSCGHREGWKVCILPPGHSGGHLSG